MGHTERVLIVDDEPAIRFGIREYLRASGYSVVEAGSCNEAERLFRANPPDIAVLDYALGDGNGLELLRKLRLIDANVPVVMLTGHGTIDLAVQAVKEGAEQFLTKPVELNALQAILDRALEQSRSRKKSAARKKKEQREEIDPFRGKSPAIRKLAEETNRVLKADRPVFIHGETGSGKGVLARFIHRSSPRAGEAFVDMNCAGLARELLESELFGHERGAFTGAVAAKQGLLEIAHRGTLFLDEIGEMDLLVQAKLLKVLEDKHFRRVGEVQERYSDVRLIAATHHNLEELVEQGKFRQDLMYRVTTLPLVVPPLRDRLEDIPMLANDFASLFAIELGRGPIAFDDETFDLLTHYPWPGNVRELRNAIERAVLLADSGRIGPKELRFLGPSAKTPSGKSPVAARAQVPEGAGTLADLERLLIEKALKEEGGRVEKAAKRLGIPRSSLYNKLKKMGIAAK